ncbi:MAG: DNRLRE domain-containing protein [Candidatus Pacebacteria bacterium]|nr:DNRLRE domain-containing protein [Candidatus Paceibacterota bacterium]
MSKALQNTTILGILAMTMVFTQAWADQFRTFSVASNASVHVSEGSPDTNYDPVGDTLSIRYSAGSSWEGFVDWDLPSITLTSDAPGSVTNAKVVFSVYNNSGKLHLCEVLGDWAKESITWNTKPAVTAVLDSATVVSGQYVFESADINTLVEDWIKGDAISYGFRVDSRYQPAAGTIHRVYSHSFADDIGLRPTLIFDAYVPEPASALLLVLASMALVCRRGRRRE